MEGMATFTMLMSTSCMKPAVSTTARATQRRGSAPPGARPGSGGGVGGLMKGAPFRGGGGVGGSGGQQGGDQDRGRVEPVAEGKDLRPGHQLHEHQLLAGAEQE